MENLMGYKFQPSNEQILYLLVEKRLSPHFSHHPIKDIVDICGLEPWDLATESTPESEDQVWYFFCEPCYKYRESNRAHRRTKAGHWKITSKDSQIKARNGPTGTKKFLTFYRHGLPPKEAITEWGMHEYHVKDDPGYKKEFILCCITRKRNKKKKRGILATDEGESSQQLVSPLQQPPSDHSISNGYHGEENSPTIPQQQLQYNNSVSYPGNPTGQNTFTYPQSITNNSPTQLSPSNHLISRRNHNEENIPTNQPLLQNHNMISCLGNHSDGTTHTYLLQLPNHNSISYPGNHIEQNMYFLPYPDQLPNHNSSSYTENGIEENMYPHTYPWVIPNYSPTQQLPCDDFFSAKTYSAENILINQQPQPNHNLISHFGNQIEENTPTHPLLLPDSNFETQLPLHHPLVTHNFADNNFQEECLPIREFKSYGGYNRLNDASFSTVQTAVHQEQELKFSNGSFDNCDFSHSEIYSYEQVDNLINSLRAFLEENSREETGKPVTSDFNPPKSDGEASAYAQDSSDTNIATNDAWMKERLENFA
ncbi:NAC domain-containing protein 7-like isoform X3 [Citrus sinensis]|uniref:NAC domain-containing protein 7-like n=1 Tax=Citrus clementina TaxID=85681 RepID=UPI0003D7566C|nr:NAC domain-containing protein 7-like isoform X3 [Citrus sinensis]XP_024039824.1 NAC domain-containing protein 7-like [Citrus x clementina]